MAETESDSRLELMSAQHMLRTLNRFSRQILEDNRDELPIVIVGIDERGGYLAGLLSSILDREISASIQWAQLDVKHQSGKLNRNVRLDGVFLIVIDDVIFSGKTMFTAFRNLMDIGEPALMKPAALIDRGHRKFPVEPQYVGKYSPTKFREHVECHFTPEGKPDSVELIFQNG